jgi:hypothetical protein
VSIYDAKRVDSIAHRAYCGGPGNPEDDVRYLLAVVADLLRDAS